MHGFRADNRRWLWLGGASLLLLLAEQAAAQSLRRYEWQHDAAYDWQMWFLYVFAYSYAFAFGASLASFLNVVVYRLPRRLNLVHPGSRCPACGTPIEARDNIPVIGWLTLGGRCRTCGVPIAPRYLLIELAIGALFVVLLHLSVFRGGVHLPGSDANVRHGLTILYSHETWRLGRVALYHACLLSLLLVCGLIQYDRQRVPGKLWGVIVGIGLMAGLVWPSLRPLAADGTYNLAAEAAGTLPHALVDGLCGLLTGGAAGVALTIAVRTRSHWPQAPSSIVLALASVGAYLGWQAALGVAVASAAGMAAAALLAVFSRPMRRLPPLCIITAAAWLFVPLWSRLADMTTRLNRDVITLCVYGLMAIVLLAFVCRLAQPANKRNGHGLR